MYTESIWSLVSRLSNRGSLEVDTLVAEVLEQFDSEADYYENRPAPQSNFF